MATQNSAITNHKQDRIPFSKLFDIFRDKEYYMCAEGTIALDLS